jgi:hypothetical protein
MGAGGKLNAAMALALLVAYQDCSCQIAAVSLQSAV